MPSSSLLDGFLLSLLLESSAGLFSVPTEELCHTCLLFGARECLWSASLPVQPPACVVEECRGRAEVVLVGVTLTRTSRTDIDAICERLLHRTPPRWRLPEEDKLREQSNPHPLLSHVLFPFAAGATKD